MSGGEVLVERSAVPWIRLAVQRLRAEMRRDGVRNVDADAYLAAFTEARDRCATSANGSAEVPQVDDSAWSIPVDPMTTEEAAEMLGTGSRNVRDLCKRGALATARQVSGRWLVERDEVLARVEKVAG